MAFVGSTIIGVWGFWTVSVLELSIMILMICYTVSDCFWKLIPNIQEDWCRQANLVVPIRQQDCSLCAEEAVDKRAESSEEKTVADTNNSRFPMYFLDLKVCRLPPGSVQ